MIKIAKKPSLLLLMMAMLVITVNAQATCNINLSNSSCAQNLTNVTQTLGGQSVAGLPINIVFAYADGCPHCKALEEYLSNLSLAYDFNITNVNAVTNQSTLTGYLSRYKVPKSAWGAVPVLFLNNTYCIGDTPCEEYLSQNIGYMSAHGTPIPTTSSSLTPLTIAELTGLALVDSINPCAFAVLIFLLSTMFMRDPNDRRKLLLGGIAFAMGIFSFYLAIGILLIFGINSVLAVTDLTNIHIYGLFGVFSIILGLLNLKDFLAYRNPKLGRFSFAMEVPLKWRPKMLGMIDVIMLKFASIPAAFAAGVLVTAFLLPCITGPYFVAGSLLKDLPLVESIAWLVYYNALFVLPMLVITLLVYSSFTSIEKAHEFREKNIHKLHGIAGVLLLLVGVIMLLQAVPL